MVNDVKFRSARLQSRLCSRAVLSALGVPWDTAMVGFVLGALGCSEQDLRSLRDALLERALQPRRSADRPARTSATTSASRSSAIA